MTADLETNDLAKNDAHWLLRAIDLSRLCPKSHGSFAVGAVVVGADGVELVTGYSLEGGAGFHAEETAIAKATAAGVSLRDATLYSSLEPCSVRLSGKRPCVAHILDAGIRRVVFACLEPPLFVRCEGAETLRRAGVQVVWMAELAGLVQQVNSHLLGD